MGDHLVVLGDLLRLRADYRRRLDDVRFDMTLSPLNRRAAIEREYRQAAARHAELVIAYRAVVADCGAQGDEPAAMKPLPLPDELRIRMKTEQLDDGYDL